MASGEQRQLSGNSNISQQMATTESRATFSIQRTHDPVRNIPVPTTLDTDSEILTQFSHVAMQIMEANQVQQQQQQQHTMQQPGNLGSQNGQNLPVTFYKNVYTPNNITSASKLDVTTAATLIPTSPSLNLFTSTGVLEETNNMTQRVPKVVERMMQVSVQDVQSIDLDTTKDNENNRNDQSSQVAENDSGGGEESSLNTDPLTEIENNEINTSSSAKSSKTKQNQQMKKNGEKNTFRDNLIWCQDCMKSYLKVCDKHGELTKVKDRQIPSRAKLTTPHYLTVKTLQMRAGGNHMYGVFARKVLQKRTQFGPYQGQVCESWQYKESDRLKVKLFNSTREGQFLDPSDENICNWMIFVRPASNSEEQNMVAYQYNKNIYFTTIKPVPPNGELRVWYAEDYRIMMEMPSLDIDETEQARENMSPPPDQEEEDIFKETENVGVETRKSRKKTEKEEIKMEAESVDEDLPQETLDGDEDYVPEDSGDNDEEIYIQKEDNIIKYEPESPDEITEAGRRTRSKRKGRPIKLSKKVTTGVKKETVPKSTRLKGKQVTRKGRPKRSTVKKKAMQARPKKLHKCEQCDQMFVSKDKLRVHFFTHTGEKPFKCTYEGCGKAFTSKFKQGRHELIHKDTKQHSCMYCMKMFSRKDHLKNHLKIHDPNKPTHVCNECGKEYASMYAFRTHMAFHLAERGELTCGVCNLINESKEELLHHLKIHAGARSVKDQEEKRHNCPLCDKKFFTKKDVKRHLVVHTKDRDFLCDYCPQTFGRRDHLVRHQRTSHAGILNNKDGIVNMPINKIPTKKSTKDKIVKIESAEVSRQGAFANNPQTSQPKTANDTPQLVNLQPLAISTNVTSLPSQTLLSGNTAHTIAGIPTKVGTVHPNFLNYQTIPASQGALTSQNEAVMSGHFVPPTLMPSILACKQPLTNNVPSTQQLQQHATSGGKDNRQSSHIVQVQHHIDPQRMTVPVLVNINDGYMIQQFQDVDQQQAQQIQHQFQQHQ